VPTAIILPVGLRRWVIALGAVLPLAAGCTAPAPLPTATGVPLFAPGRTPSARAATAPVGGQMRTPTLPARATAVSGCKDSASFLEDLTIPDGTGVLPGAALDKRWSVRNTGTCDWGPDYRLVRVGASEIRGPDDIALYPAAAGSTAVWQVPLVAPSQPGEYLGRWQARAPDGTLFGDEVFVLIEVAEPAATATTPPSATP